MKYPAQNEKIIVLTKRSGRDSNQSFNYLETNVLTSPLITRCVIKLLVFMLLCVIRFYLCYNFIN